MELQKGLGAAGKISYGRRRMNSVNGLDISKAESHGQAYFDRGQPDGGTFRFENTQFS
jgi:hypothetical protein